MKEPPKCLIIGTKVLARRCNAMWDILLMTEDALKALAGNILTTKSVRLQTEYMGTRKTNVTFHGASLYIGEDLLGFYFAKFREVAVVLSVKSKAGIATGDFEIMLTLTRNNFIDITNILTCSGRPIYVDVEGRRPLCCFCRAAENLAPERGHHHNPNHLQAGKQQ